MLSCTYKQGPLFHPKLQQWPPFEPCDTIQPLAHTPGLLAHHSSAQALTWHHIALPLYACLSLDAVGPQGMVMDVLQAVTDWVCIKQTEN
jgi:hypothetical protein